jgi:hypothetical protein
VASAVYLYLETGTFELREHTKLPRTHISVLHILMRVTDDMCSVKPYLMKPHEKESIAGRSKLQLQVLKSMIISRKCIQYNYSKMEYCGH